MPVNAVGSSSSGDAIGSAISAASGNQNLGQQEFLQLLVTQLTHQDPLAPQDQSQFLAQLAQFSTVEGINNMATSQSHLQASTMLGRTVDAKIVSDNVP